MTNIYSMFDVIIPKGFGATYISVVGAFPGSGFCFPSLTQAVMSQAEHIKPLYKPLYSINQIEEGIYLNVYITSDYY